TGEADRYVSCGFHGAAWHLIEAGAGDPGGGGARGGGGVRVAGGAVAAARVLIPAVGVGVCQRAGADTATGG
ncbi:hypothetical protein, partial [Streptomyces sp. URMC 123]|uniref:hypothetical protein n=1 Tax=Streptomyces sp. URMC 123 TaxID=3423403 RepID=UPI003F1A6A7D